MTHPHLEHLVELFDPDIYSTDIFGKAIHLEVGTTEFICLAGRFLYHLLLQSPKPDTLVEEIKGKLSTSDTIRPLGPWFSPFPDHR